MALRLIEQDTRRVAFGFDADIRRNVYLVVGSLTPEQRADFTRELMTHRRRQDLANMPAAKFNDHLRKAAERQAAAVLRDSVDFTLALSPAIAKEFQEATKLGAEAGVIRGELWEIRLDGRWTAEVKAWMFKFVPRIVDIVIPESNKIGDLEEAEDAEEVAAFRS